MKIEVTFQPVFHLPLTEADAHLLMELALAHYDWACIGAGRVGGFIFGWRNWLRTDGEALADAPPSRVQATRDQLDLTLKVLELRRSGMLHGRDADQKRADALGISLRIALDRWPWIKPAPTTIDTEKALG